jgi:hypothetical protein
VAGELRRERAQNPRGMFFEPTPKGHRFYELCRLGKSDDEAFAIADREFTLDGLLPRRGTADLDAVLSGGIEQTGQVQF